MGTVYPSASLQVPSPCKGGFAPKRSPTPRGACTLWQTCQAVELQPSPTTLGSTVHLAGRLGGWFGRSCDLPPDHQFIRRGHTRLQDLCAGWELWDATG